MKKIRIHRFENEKWGRYHLPWFKKFSDYLKDFFDVEVINYNIDGKTFSGKINLQTSVGQFGKTPPLSDVDCVIENLDNNEFLVLTFTKYFTSYVVHYLKSDKCIGILSAHFSRRFIYEYLKINNLQHKLELVHPWFFGFFKEFDVDYYRKIRDEVDKLNDKLYFKGGGWKDEKNGYRKVIKILYDEGYLNPHNILFENYLKELSLQKIAVSHYMDVNWFVSANEHPGELCYRDIEMMSLGVPYIRIEYKSELHGAFIPNYHYITIPRETAHHAYTNKGHEGVAQLFIDKYNEVKNDVFFLQFISKNQRKWYDKNMKWPKSAELTFKLLNLQQWIK
jgi:hypothetical protein